MSRQIAAERGRAITIGRHGDGAGLAVRIESVRRRAVSARAGSTALREAPVEPDRRRRTYLIQDPYDYDAIEFIRTVDNYFGLRPVCFYTDPKARFYGERQFPVLTSELIEAAYDVDVADLSTFVDDVRDRFDIAGIIPYREDTVEVAADLCDLLDLDWVAPDILRRFRDKHELKVHVRSVDPSVRVPLHRLIRQPADLEAGFIPQRFVVKPNDGFGNRDIGIFGVDELDAAAAHVASNPGQTWILEEYIGGVEYHIDGLVRAPGDVQPLAVFEYLRIEANDYQTVYLGEVQCSSEDPIFDVLVEYATRLLAATGLQRCPFHLEVKVDELGPCVVDLGARFASEGGAKNLSRLHPGRPDAFAVAAHDYLGENSMELAPVDFTDYDRHRTVLVYGVSANAGLIDSVNGADDVERRPEFVRWLVKPHIGDSLDVTRDLRGAPYIVELSCDGDRPAALQLIDEVQQAISWNDVDDRWKSAQAVRTHFSHRLRSKVAWMVRRVRRRGRFGSN